jgi:hypothetical protein
VANADEHQEPRPPVRLAGVFALTAVILALAVAVFVLLYVVPDVLT